VVRKLSEPRHDRAGGNQDARDGVGRDQDARDRVGRDHDARDSVVDLIRSGQVGLVVNTPHGVTSGGSPRIDGYEIRTAAVAENIPCVTTVQGLAAAVQGIEALRAADIGVRSLQDWAQAISDDARWPATHEESG